MNFLQLCRDYHVETAGPEHHHVSQGWIGIHCPFCSGGKNFHMGFNISKEFFTCWRCGSHTLRETLERLTGEEFGYIWSKYGGGRSAPSPARRVKGPEKQTELTLPPSFTEPLRNDHARYLQGRGFDPDELIEEWGVCSTSPIATLRPLKSDGQSYYGYGNRIFIPIYWDGRLVSFQARSLKTRKDSMKYKACPATMEARSLRHIIYRHPETASDYGLCVEGVTDVWRFGKQAFAMLGVGYSKWQVALVSQLYKRVVVLFDPDEPGQERAARVARDLRILGVVATNHVLHGGDPAELSNEEASELIQSLLDV